MPNSDETKPIEAWKIVLALVTLGIFAFVGYVASYPGKIGIVVGIVIWVIVVGWLSLGKALGTVLEGQKRKLEREEKGSALEILEKRYASGEIDRKEYEERRKVLTSTEKEGT